MSAKQVDLAAIRARAEAATEGPWRHDDGNEGTEYRPFWEVTNEAFHNPPPGDEDAPWLAVEIHTGIEADAEFIATARTDVPVLLDLVEAQEAEIERLRVALARESETVMRDRERLASRVRETDEARTALAARDAALGAVAALADEWDEADGNGLDSAVQSIRLSQAVADLRERLAPASGAVETVTGRLLIEAERRRQIEIEGYSIDHDFEHGSSALRSAARCYQVGTLGPRWPWDSSYWKPKDRLSDLIRAGALFLAAREVEEIERGPIGYSNAEADRCAFDIDGILDRARAVLAPVSGAVEDRCICGGLAQCARCRMLGDAVEGAGVRHFAPYGSYNATCDETVPTSTPWDVRTGEYATDRFTVHRDKTTCPDCRQRMGLTPTPVAVHEQEVRAEEVDIACVTCTVCDELIVPSDDAVPDGERWAHRDCAEAGE